MYLLFREKGWKPSDYYCLPEGEKKVIKVFLQTEMDERRNELEKAEKEAGKR